MMITRVWHWEGGKGRGDNDTYTGMGEVVTVCQPHYDETVNIGDLLGVACADITLTMLQGVGADRDVRDDAKLSN